MTKRRSMHRMLKRSIPIWVQANSMLFNHHSLIVRSLLITSVCFFRHRYQSVFVMFYKDLFDAYGTIPFHIKSYAECGDKPGVGCGLNNVYIYSCIFVLSEEIFNHIIFFFFFF